MFVRRFKMFALGKGRRGVVYSLVLGLALEEVLVKIRLRCIYYGGSGSGRKWYLTIQLKEF